ncbi:hypothetical protein DPMN_193617 [Dreissena polymorpha]|uniref:Fibronectin type-III domain-containing protein n=1 Tax=Dreissena polymorpha TaxID=45954 RepID=A0A9D4BDA1_DREPO|nr:hypothetical protein DPMN_193617 [Dreissena polymorpha]
MECTLDLGYTVEKFQEGLYFWEKVPGMPMCKSIIVTGLKTGVKFKFRVMAENIYGIGEPLETDFPVLVKNRFGELMLFF